MVSLFALWLPILLAAVAVFVVSSVIHMVLPYHRSDFGKIEAEDAVMDALRPFRIPPGDYVLPWAGTTKQMEEPGYVEKLERGPVAFVTVMPGGKPSMAGSLVQWFVYCVVVGIFALYVAGRSLGPGAQYLDVFRIASVTSFAGYGLALLQNSIWYKRSWAATLKSVFDAGVYGLVTGGVAGWLWPG